MFNCIISTDGITVAAFLICLLAAVVFGLLTALVFTTDRKHSSSFTLSLALLPPIVTLVIMLVNGNIGAGLAVAGTFALVRFRSAPGSAKEITGLFFAVALGLACGMGYIGFGLIFFVVVALFCLVLEKTGFGKAQESHLLRITIPENLDYEGVFDDLFEKYTESCQLTKVKTSSMGTLFDLTYTIVLKDSNNTKAFIDDLRCRNGNLGISISRPLEKNDVM